MNANISQSLIEDISTRVGPARTNAWRGRGVWKGSQAFGILKQLRDTDVVVLSKSVIGPSAPPWANANYLMTSSPEKKNRSMILLTLHFFSSVPPSHGE